MTTTHFKGLSLHAVFMLIPMIHDHRREEHGRILAELARITEFGALKPMLDQSRFKLSENAQAIGKVVVEN